MRLGGGSRESISTLGSKSSFHISIGGGGVELHAGQIALPRLISSLFTDYGSHRGLSLDGTLNHTYRCHLTWPTE